MDVTPDEAKVNAATRIGSQPIAIAASALVVIVLGAASIFLWRSSTGTVPEQERVTTARITQARVAQASEQLVEKTKGLESSQQQSIDQLQVVQDQLQVVQQLLSAQRVETRKLSEQVGGLTAAMDTLRQSFASTQPTDAAEPAPARKKVAARPAPRKKARYALMHRKRSR
jgi:hypothetical protein